jgi:hypothetical protein
MTVAIYANTRPKVDFLTLLWWCLPQRTAHEGGYFHQAGHSVAALSVLFEREQITALAVRSNNRAIQILQIDNVARRLVHFRKLVNGRMLYVFFTDSFRQTVR